MEATLMSINRWMDEEAVVHTHSGIFSSVQFSCSVMSNSLWPHESQHARPPCPSPSPGVHSNSRPSSRWCYPPISSSVVPFSSCPQSLPASESFPMSQLVTWGGQSTGVSASASFLPKKSQGWSPSEWTGWIVHFKKHVVMEIIKITTITLTLMHQVLLWVRSVPSMLQSRES